MAALSNWPDTGLYHRLRNALHLMVRGKGSYGLRAYAAAQQILVLTPESFPDDKLRQHFLIIQRLATKEAGRYENALAYSGMKWLTPAERDQFTLAVMELFEAAAVARSKQIS
jgi:hypothetical protein